MDEIREFLVLEEEEGNRLDVIYHLNLEICQEAISKR